MIDGNLLQWPCKNVVDLSFFFVDLFYINLLSMRKRKANNHTVCQHEFQPPVKKVNYCNIFSENFIEKLLEVQIILHCYLF